MNPFTRLPNELIDEIFFRLDIAVIWKFQQSSASSEKLLDSHLRVRPYALDELMFYGCQNGNNEVVRKAVSLGANVSIISRKEYDQSTILCASTHLKTVSLLFDLGARLDIHGRGFTTRDRRGAEDTRCPKFYQLCWNRGARDQFVDFQGSIDSALYMEVLRAKWSTFLMSSQPYEWSHAIRSVRSLVKLGANSTATFEENPGRGTILTRFIHDCTNRSSTLSGASFIKLLLSEQSDINAAALQMTHGFLEQRPDGSLLQCTCPIVAAVQHMGRHASTVILDSLLEAGAKLDLPVHASLQPLFTYAMETETYDSPGYEYLCSRGARFEPVWHPQEPVEDHDLLPIFLLCHNWQDELLLNDGRFGVLKLFVERGAVKNVGLRFIRNALRPMAAIEAAGRGWETKNHITEIKSSVAERSQILLQSILQDGNLDPNIPREMDELLLEVVEQAYENAGGTSNMRFSNIIDPILVDLLLQKGATLGTRSRTKYIRDHVASQLKRAPYFLDKISIVACTSALS